MSRRKKVLQLLHERGPLSIRGLRSCILPTISVVALQKVLGRLIKNKLVIKKYDKIFRGAGVFYQLTNSEKHLEGVARLLSVDMKSLSQPKFRHVELLHSESCAVWACEFVRLLPTVRVLQEHQFSDEPLLEKFLMTYREDKDWLPDIILLSQNQQQTNHVCVAVEIERTPKTNKRLIRRLKKYTRESRLDGLIYLCGQHSLAERVRTLYVKNVMPESIRIKHYGNNFCLFGDETIAGKQQTTQLHNAALQTVSLEKWMNTLIHNPLFARADNGF